MKNISSSPQKSSLPTSQHEIDLHGMDISSAKKALDSFIAALPRGSCTLTVIHGFNRGSVLQKYVRVTYSNKRLERKLLSLNEGVTDFILK